MVELLILQPLPLPHGLERGAGGQGFLWITGFWRFLHKGPAAGDDRGRSLSVRLWPLASWEAGETAAPEACPPTAPASSSSHVSLSGREHLLPVDVASREDTKEVAQAQAASSSPPMLPPIPWSTGGGGGHSLGESALFLHPLNPSCSAM